MEITIYILVAFTCGIIADSLGKAKGQNGCFLYGFLLGILGIIIVSCLKDKSKEINITKTTNNNKYEDLEKLQKLKETGVITDMEFETEKQKLLK